MVLEDKKITNVMGNSDESFSPEKGCYLVRAYDSQLCVTIEKKISLIRANISVAHSLKVSVPCELSQCF